MSDGLVLDSSLHVTVTCTGYSQHNRQRQQSVSHKASVLSRKPHDTVVSDSLLHEAAAGGIANTEA